MNQVSPQGQSTSTSDPLRLIYLIEATYKEAAIAVNREAHGMVAGEIIEVTEGK